MSPDLSWWTRQTLYVVAGTFAAHRLDEASGEDVARALARAVQTDPKMQAYAERWFTCLLQVDDADLVRRRLLRLLTPLSDTTVDWAMLTRDLLRWPRRDKAVQRRWARHYYRYTERKT